jgi:manganese/zinc/iron transport system substrate-binding protein
MTDKLQTRYKLRAASYEPRASSHEPRIASYRLTATKTIVLLLILALTSCTPKTEKVRTGKLKVVTTTGMIEDAVKNIAGNRVDVLSLMGPGVDPHLYKATQGDLQKLTDADVVFYNGLHLEGKMGEVLEKLARTKTVVAVGGEVSEERLRTITEGVHDPHIWFNVDLWKLAVVVATKTLVEKDSTNASEYETNSQKYLAMLDSLHTGILLKMKEIPESQRVLITAHDAFGYFGDAYGVEVRGLQGISTVSEFGLKDVTELVNFIIERKIKAIFVETSVSEKSINAVVEGCREKNWEVKIGGSLYSDAMGQSGTPEGTYVGMVSKNVQTIVEALR